MASPRGIDEGEQWVDFARVRVLVARSSQLALCYWRTACQPSFQSTCKAGHLKEACGNSRTDMIVYYLRRVGFLEKSESDEFEARAQRLVD